MAAILLVNIYHLFTYNINDGNKGRNKGKECLKRGMSLFVKQLINSYLWKFRGFWQGTD